MFNKIISGIKNLYYVMFPPTPVEVFRKMGVQIGKNVHIANFGVIIDPSLTWLIKIGDNALIAPNVHILAHDGSMLHGLNYSKIGLVDIKNNVFIGAGSLILPGVTIGENSVIGAGSIVSKDIPENSVALGNPAKVVCSKDEYIEKQRLLMNDENCFDESYTIKGKITVAKKNEMIAVLLKYRTGFLE
jgi:maltose O-acetyltransferase